MEYSDIIKNMRRFGSSDAEICQSTLGIAPEEISPLVIVSPGWPPERLFAPEEITPLVQASPLFGFRLWRIETGGKQATYVRTGFGAPMVMDALLLLGLTRPEQILFISSVGALSKEISVGDILLPRVSSCGDGAGRYLSADPWRDAYGEEQTPEAAMLRRLAELTDKICQDHSVAWHYGNTLCVDTIVAQYMHLERIIECGYDSVDMESAVAFKAARRMGIPAAALLHVSDNSVLDQSLLSARDNHGGRAYRSFVRKEVLPKIVRALFFE
ncbi:MAG: hypothetical protein J6D21_02670 [Clostridia bacterium]|nr:hypothetical protein [Clostridia bacterium]